MCKPICYEGIYSHFSLGTFARFACFACFSRAARVARVAFALLLEEVASFPCEGPGGGGGGGFKPSVSSSKIRSKVQLGKYCEKRMNEDLPSRATALFIAVSSLRVDERGDASRAAAALWPRAGNVECGSVVEFEVPATRRLMISK